MSLAPPLFFPASVDADTVVEKTPSALGLEQVDDDKLIQETEFPDGGLRAWGNVFGVRTSVS